MLGLSGISQEGLRYFSNHAGDFEKLDSIQIANSPLADGCLKKLTECRQLNIAIYGNPGFLANPTHAQLAEIARLPNLKYLVIAYPINDSDLDQLSGSQSLKDLRIYNSNVTQAAADAFEKSNPACTVTIGQ